MKTVILKGKKSDLQIGDGFPIVVNCNVGANDRNEIDSERVKIDTLCSNPETRPDLFMDLSIPDFSDDSLYKYISLKYGLPVGIIPTYNLYCKFARLDDNQLLDDIEKLAQNGLAFMTMHITADNDILEIAKRDRKLPVTSRGGCLVLKDNFGKQTENVYRRNLDSIASLSVKYGFAISLGATFRPASIVDACDAAHKQETQRQIELAKYLHSKGVSVMIENVGHIGIDKIAEHSYKLRQAEAPIMPLGPSVMDSAVGVDHIAAAIGAAFMGYNQAAHIINAISPAEHQTSTFTIQNAIDAVKSAKVAAQAINLTRCQESLNKETGIYEMRASKKSCMFGEETPCSRCSTMCPLKTLPND